MKHSSACLIYYLKQYYYYLQLEVPMCLPPYIFLQCDLYVLGRDPLAGLNHWKDINAVAGLLRVYFRELEDPLFPSSHYQDFIKASCKYSAFPFKPNGDQHQVSP